MELGANRRSLTQLAVLLVLLAVVVYFQFLRGPGGPSEPPSATTATPGPAAADPLPGGRQPRRRFQPRMGGASAEAATDPMTADATIRKDRLARLREIDEPSIERDIFNFGRPKPVTVQGPTREELLAAQRRLEQARQPATPPPPEPARPEPEVARVVPPDWKYYGLASLSDMDARRGFLLDGEEILVVAEGSRVRDKYRIAMIGLSEIEVEDIDAGQGFSIQLEVAR